MCAIDTNHIRLSIPILTTVFLCQTLKISEGFIVTNCGLVTGPPVTIRRVGNGYCVHSAARPSPSVTAMAPRKNMHPGPSEPPLYGDRRRVAFVTGASRGLGKAIALRLARDGLNVAVNDIESENLEKVRKELEQLGAKSVALVGDVSDETRVEQMVQEVAKELGYLDVMVSHCLAIFPSRG